MHGGANQTTSQDNSWATTMYQLHLNTLHLFTYQESFSSVLFMYLISRLSMESSSSKNMTWVFILVLV